MNRSRDTAGVIAPPPLISAAAFGLGLLLDRLVPLGGLAPVPFWPRAIAGVLLIAAGGAMIVAAGHRFHAAGTPAPPWKPTSAIVTNGIYALMRNPMYVAFVLMGLGVAAAFVSPWAAILQVPAALALHHGVVLREERYLERKFGADYVGYVARVKRYGLF